MTLNEIIEDLEHTIEYFKHPKTQVQVGRIYQAEKTLKQLRLYAVVERSEQLTCPRCKSTNILSPDKDNDAQCIECAFIWAG